MTRKIHGDEVADLLATRKGWDSGFVLRPQVHHPPAWLVVASRLAKLFARLGRFAARHPLFTVFAVVSAWACVVYGWQAYVVAVAVVAFALVVWAMAHRDTFARFAGRPALAAWRAAWVYRRHWQPVMVVTGLAEHWRDREYLPTIRKVRCTRWTDRVLVRMIYGQHPKAWENAAAGLAHGFNAPWCRVSVARPRHLWVEFPRGDALGTPIPALPIAEVDLRRLPVGRCDDGTPYLLRLAGTHVLLAGMTGSGKGSFQWSTIRALLPAVHAGLVEIWAIDPKRMELSYGRPLFARYAADPADCVAVLEDGVGVMLARADDYAGRVRTHTPRPGHPFIVVMVDEAAFLTAYHPDHLVEAGGVR
ncbi:MAG: FtsK/SpoIIIE domain-containing protein [Nocardioidaceae bacterium]